MVGELSSEDQIFVSSVGKTFHSATDTLWLNIEKEIEDYLRQRLQELENEKENEIQTIENSHLQVCSVKDEVIASLEAQSSKWALLVHQLTEKMGEEHQRTCLRQAWQSWINFKQQSLHRKQIAIRLAAITERSLQQRRWAAWRLFTAIASQRKRSEVLMKSTERKLLTEVSELKKSLANEQRAHEEAEDQRKTALVRGVAALNREAVQVLRGESSDSDVQAIEKILRGDTPISNAYSPQIDSSPIWADPNLRSRVSPSSHVLRSGEGSSGFRDSIKGDGSPINGILPSAERICPVHHVDEAGNFYHKCFKQSPNTSIAGSVHQPLFIRVDPNQGIPVGKPAPLLKLRNMSS